MRGRLITILVLAALLAAGCGDDSAEPTTTTTVASTTTVAPTTTTTSQAATTTTTTTTAPTLETVEFTGHTDCRETSATWSGPALADDVAGTSLETSYDCVYTITDGRVSGTGPAVVRVDMSLNGDTRVGEISGTAVISNEGGTWESTVWGTTTWTLTNQSHVHVMDSEGLGTGGYEGLRLLIHQEGIGFPWTTTGRVEPAQ
jgi:hypothetical protein